MTTDPDSRSSKPDDADEPGAFLRSHRRAVESTTRMPPSIMLGSSFALAVGLLAWGGHRWDEAHDSEPWGVLAGIALGFLYGGYEVWKISRTTRNIRSKGDEGKSEGGPTSPEDRSDP